MNKREFFNNKNNRPAAYYSGCGGIEIYSIEYGIYDTVFYIAGAWTGQPTKHKTRIYYNNNGEGYFLYHGYKIPFSECIRMEV